MAVIVIAVVALAVILVPRRVTPLSHGPTAPDAARDFTSAQISRSAALAASLQPNALISLVLSLLISAALGLTSLGARIVTVAAKPLGGGWVWQVLLGSLALAVIGRLATLPLSAYAENVRRRYGLSTRDWALWTVDVAKSVAIGVALTGLILVILYGSMRLAAQWWWAIAACTVAGLVVLASFCYPVVIEPVFNTFESMPQSQLRTDLLALAERDEVVVYDTLLDSESSAVIETIVAHELGHSKNKDVLLGTALGALGAAAMVVAGFLLAGWTPLLSRAGAASLSDPRSLALVLFVVAVAGLVLTPVQSMVSRRIESRADAHALELTRDPASFLEMHRRLGVGNLADLDPNRLYYWMLPLTRALWTGSPRPGTGRRPTA